MALLAPMTRLLFIASFKPQFRDKVTAMYDLYLRTHKMPSVAKLTAKAVVKDSIPWVAIPTVMAAILRRGLYNTPGLVWGSTKVIGGTALAASILHAAFKAPGEYQDKKRSVPRDYAAAAQDHILTQLLKNASLTAPGTPTPPAQHQTQQASATAVLNAAVQPRQNTWLALLWVIAPQNVQPIMAGAAKQNQAPVQSAPVLPKSQQPQKLTLPASNAPLKPATLDQDAAAAYNKAKVYGRDFMYTTFAPGALGDRNRMITFGGLALLLAALSGQNFGSALLMGGLGVGLGALINKYMLPRVGGKSWGQALKFIYGIKDPTLKQRVQTSGGRAVLDFIMRKFSGNTYYDAPGLAFKDYVSKLLSADAPSGGMRYGPKAGYTLSTGSGTTIYAQDLLANRLSGGQRPQTQSGNTTQLTIDKTKKTRPTLRTA